MVIIIPVRYKFEGASSSPINPAVNFLIREIGSDKNLLVSASQIVRGVPESACTAPIAPTRATG